MADHNMEELNREHHLEIQQIRNICLSKMKKDNPCVYDDENVAQIAIDEIDEDIHY